jgi:hypothetical protein
MPEQVLANLRAQPCLAVTFVKLDAKHNRDYGEWKFELIERLITQAKSETRYVFGTLGWYELVVITCGKTLETVIQESLAFGCAHHEVTAKTYSIICIGKTEFQQLLAKEEKPPSGLPFAEPVPSTIYPQLAISASPGSRKEIQGFWESARSQAGDPFQIRDSVGKDDFLVLPPERVSWGSLLSNLLRFRQEHGTKVLYTQLRVAGKAGEIKNVSTDDKKETSFTGKEASPARSGSEPSWLLKLESGIQADLVAYLGIHAAKRLISMTEYLYSMQRNPIVGDAFEDLLAYANDIPWNFQHKAEGVREPVPARGLMAADLIKQGVELRLYGIHGTTGELSLQLPPLRSGVHRILLGLEGFIYRILSNRLESKWPGFVNTSAKPFFSSVQTVNVPYNCLYLPTDWWAIYHEIGHIFIDSNEYPHFLRRESPAVKTFLSRTKVDSDQWFDLLKEIVAEIIGYELGFYGDFDLFRKRLWEYLHQTLLEKRLNAEDPHALEERQVEPYLIRSFAVKLYSSSFPQLGDTSMPDTIESMYEAFLEHIEWVYESGLKISIPRSTKCFLAAKHAKTLYDLKDFLYHVKNFFHEPVKNKKWPLPKKTEIEIETGGTLTNTGDVRKSLLEGRVWTSEVSYPEAVLFHLMQEEHKQDGSRKLLSIEVMLATVLTFWNLYRLGRSHNEVSRGLAP